jgi:hypothetical protein
MRAAKLLLKIVKCYANEITEPRLGNKVSLVNFKFYISN